MLDAEAIAECLISELFAALILTNLSVSRESVINELKRSPEYFKCLASNLSVSCLRALEALKYIKTKTKKTLFFSSLFSLSSDLSAHFFFFVVVVVVAFFFFLCLAGHEIFMVDCGQVKNHGVFFLFPLLSLFFP